MGCWTCATEFVFGWTLYPVQAIPALGGVRLSELGELLSDGVLCTIGRNGSAASGCTAMHAATFWSYLLVDFIAFYLGLWIIRRFGASFKSFLAGATLPLQQLVLCSPLVGRWAERFFWGDGVALCLVLTGFAIYQGCSNEGREAKLEASRRLTLMHDVAPVNVSSSEDTSAPSTETGPEGALGFHPPMDSTLRTEVNANSRSKDH
mmetsp:Transcript_26263/g.52678  ORF Transcript_26263/g.52678 Transcript_26263/m.52678 type:complete len:206 (-) Transcript_26263:66-683(-)